MYGGALIRALRERFPGRALEVRGLGGDAMRAEGATLLYHTDALGAMGIFEVLGKLRFFRRVLSEMEALAREWRPDVLITLDYYSFNVALAERVRPLGVRTVQYISPKVWVIKRLWTSSYVCLAGGWSLLLCALFHLLADTFQLRRSLFFLTFIGANALWFYFLPRYFNFRAAAWRVVGGCTRAWVPDAAWRGVIGAVAGMAALWLAVWLLRRTSAARS